MTYIRPRITRYIFIDGAYFRGHCSDLTKKLSPKFEFEVNWQAVLGGYDRGFYYDSLPSKKDGQKQLDFDAEYAERELLHNALGKVTDLHVREGESRFRTGRHKRRVQKGVDVLLAIEVYQHAVQGNIDEAHILVGDLDFFPLFDALVQTRVKTTLLYSPWSFSKDLIPSADKAVPLHPEESLRWASADYQKRLSNTGNQDGEGHDRDRD